MRRLGGVAAAAVLALAGQAWANRNDFRVHQLGNPADRPEANADFRAFARELGAGLSSVTLAPPETLGYSGFNVNLELSAVSFDTSAVRFPTERAFRSPLLLPSLHVRKGLPWSFELGARLAWIEESRMFAPTAELKWAVAEGYPYIPDIGIRVHGTRLLNARDFDLTVLGVDLSLGKEFAVGGAATLTPYAGWNLVWVGATSNNIDFNPGRTEQEATATPIAQLTDTGVYDSLSLSNNGHSRFYAGLRFITGIFQLGAEFSYANLGRIRVATSEGTARERNLPSVFALNTSVGLNF
ncbi:MAG TPA: hypothetical protein VEY30_07910 [Myxococcaceae bacterium]|nr:hypothetical protein [Myxococcaceae bacterium]